MVSFHTRITPMNRVLITGCAGYIGSHLARALGAQGVAVRGLDRDAVRMEALARVGVEPIVGDVDDQTCLRTAVQGCDYVYHLAGSPLGTAEQIIAANVRGIRNMVALCGPGSGVKLLLYASSGALYPSGSQWLDEDTLPVPSFGYAQAKYVAEQELLTAYTTHGVPVVLARIAGVYGPHGPALMIKQVRRGQFPLIGGGKGYATYIHIEDTVTALLRLSERGVPGRIYNLADDCPVTIREFYNYLAMLLGGPPPRTLHPALAGVLVRLMTWVAGLSGRAAPLPTDLVAMAAVSHRISNRRMRDELGVELRYPTYREGLPTCAVEA